MEQDDKGRNLGLPEWYMDTIACWLKCCFQVTPAGNWLGLLCNYPSLPCCI